MRVLFFLLTSFSLFAQEEGINVRGKKEAYKPTTISNKEARQTAGTLGEPLRVIETLPGVVIPSFLGGEIIIRGTNPNANAYYIDDLPIFYPFHYLGLNAVISNYLWDGFILDTGSYSSLYGNATGGVIALTTKENIIKPSKYFSSSLFSTHIHWEEKIDKHELTLAGRINYMRETYGKLNLVQSGVQLPTYNDTQIKYRYTINSNHSLLFYNLMANDSFSLDLSQNSDNTNSLVTGAKLASGKGFRTTALRHNYSNDKINHRFTLIDYNPREQVNGELGNLRANYSESFGYHSIRQDLDWTPFRSFKIKQGLEVKRLKYKSNGFTVYETKPGNLAPNPFSSQNPDYQERNIDESLTTLNPSAYLEFSYALDKWKFIGGVRHDSIHSKHQNSTTPRARIEYFFHSGWSAFLRGGSTSRFPGGNEIAKNSGNPNLGFEKNISSGIGLKREWENKWEMQVEIFEQKLENLVVPDNYSGEYFTKNPNPELYGNEPFLFYRSNFFSNSGEGRSKGVELLLKKKNPESRPMSWGGWISYTYSETFRRTNVHEPIFQNYDEREKLLIPLWNNSRETYYDYDQRHIFNLILNFMPSRDWLVGLRWQYRTSFPYTEIIGDDGGGTRNPYNSQRVYFPVYSTERNTSRLPPFHRLDLRFDKIIRYEWGEVKYFLEFINAYARTNYVERQFKSGRPFSEINPTNAQDPAVLPIKKFTNLPLINFGLEVKF